ncbi:conserved protein of unknown function [Methylacidimicrobium sp. AP8]|uniref:type V CRISPR-associated protein Cas12b n=1 Tax=Methylacidimicrobium sp. AP8 TaxID=2730359 RepID=UPI0018C0DDBA|nr:type V CRISPR-associated protein Cas12b [Methylacidimicrobium sp. AP8]CAB4243826.1 conserved protein of unknown function [Methylacidimicrobium sp. AP8]
MKQDIPPVQRAYTLRLGRGAAESPSCHRSVCDDWRDRLWKTHEAVNKGAKAFGEWLLTLRGGLCHTLIDIDVPGKGGRPARRPTDRERSNRRILLALSWLTVEDERGAPNIVARATEEDNRRAQAVEKALRTILEKRGVPKDEIEEWLRDCKPSLGARLREGAVWVNRSEVFDKRSKELAGLDRHYAQSTIMDFFGPEAEYLTLPVQDQDRETPSLSVGDESDDAAVFGEETEFSVRARRWISTNFGAGRKSDCGKIGRHLRLLAKADLSRFGSRPKAELVEEMAKLVCGTTVDFDGLVRGIGWSTGRPSKGYIAIKSLPEHPSRTDIERMQKTLCEEAGKKEGKSAGLGKPQWMQDLRQWVEECCGMPFRTDRDHTDEYSVMLDHAARRVSAAHSWIKKAEQRRREFEKAARILVRLQDRAPQAKAWLDRYCADRAAATGAGVDSGYRIRRRAIAGWEPVVKAWAGTRSGTEEERIIAARQMQDELKGEKFGDIQLFEDLAADEASCVWRGRDGKPDPSILVDYVEGSTAEHDRKRFRVPAYRHPDALRHPVFCEFGKSRWRIKFAIHENRKEETRQAEQEGRAARRKKGGHPNLHGLQMRLWDGRSADDVDLRWSSKRFAADLGLNHEPDANAPKVSRADRLGKAASKAVGPVVVMNVFQEKDWNGRLQAPRAGLERIAKLEEKGDRERAQAARSRLPWFLSFSARLLPKGPFISYARSLGFALNPRGKCDPNAAANKGRKQLAKLMLSRLPGLRLLAVDLGHRFAAACAVWEALSPDAFAEQIRRLGARGTGADDMYLHVKQTGSDGKPRTHVYRRIGPDKLPDGSEHPAPWARLQRQFLLKLQGEEEPARWAARQETDKVLRWEQDLGRDRTDPQDALPHRVDELMSEAVRTFRQALRRHADRARIAFNLASTEKLLPGGATEKLDQAGRVELLTQTLILWHDLFTAKGWKDQWAAHEWQKRGLSEVPIPEEKDASPAARRGLRKQLEDAFKPYAERLASTDLADWSRSWSDRWKKDDAEWVDRLKELKRWIAPRCLKRKKEARAAARYVGGLSLTRINRISELYEILKAFKMRPEPQNLRKNIPEKGDDALANFHRRLLDVRDRLREQRVKQLASRIVEAALGAGRIKIPKRGCAAKRPRLPERPRNPVDAPCHAVVVESLRHYRPDDLRLRRENRLLMEWSSAKVQKYLSEECQLYGLCFLEVPANYTSRQCSRTGLPGMRCVGVSADQFLHARRWQREVEAARKRLAKNGIDPRDRFLIKLADRLKKLAADQKLFLFPSTVLVPQQGGDLFLAAPPQDADLAGVSEPALQADLNAAANIGLRALLDPDWAGRWWYVPCRGGTSEPIMDKIKGSAAFAGIQRKLPVDGGASSPPADKGRTGTREVENLWRDPSADGLDKGIWRPTRAYWNAVQSRVVRLLLRSYGLDS